jgi:hypothetical protein
MALTFGLSASYLGLLFLLLLDAATCPVGLPCSYLYH